MKSIITNIVIGIGNTFQHRYWYWYRQYFMAEVLLLVLTIVLTSTVNIPVLQHFRNVYIRG